MLGEIGIHLDLVLERNGDREDWFCRITRDRNGNRLGRTPQVISANFLIANRIETFVGSVGCNSTSEAGQPYALRSLIGRL